MHFTSLASVSLLALTPIVSAKGPHGALVKRHLNSVRHWRKRAADPEWIAQGTLTTAEGCGQFYHVQSGDYCYQVAEKFNLTLQQFYDMNPGIDSDCLNLWADYDYCVSRTAQASASVQAAEIAQPATTTKYQTVNAGAGSSTVITANPTATPVTKPAVQANVQASATSSAPAAASTDSSEDDDGEECEADGDDDDSSSSAAPSSTSAASSDSRRTKTVDSQQQQQQQTQAPAVQANAVQSSQQSSSSSDSSSSSSSSSSGGISAFFSKLGINAFLGDNTGAIASWFHTDASSDSTNGRSWCEFPYTDSTPGFAPSVGRMINNFGGNQAAAKQAFCGLEATFTTPDGKSATLFLVDGFDDTWVRTPSSIDVVYNAFAQLWGSVTSDKNNVVQNVQWQFTGNRNPKYTYKGQGDS